MLALPKIVERRMNNLVARFCLTCALLLSPATLVLAQNNAAQAQTPAKAVTRLAIHAGRLLDARSGQYQTNVYIRVEGDRIASVGSSAPAGMPIIDLSSQTVLPGLTDCHAHILGNQKDQTPTAPLRMSSPIAALWGYHNLQIWLDQAFASLGYSGVSHLAYGQRAVREAIKPGTTRRAGHRLA